MEPSKWSTQTKQAFSEWLVRSTWHTNHPADIRRWYEFVDQYEKIHGTSVDESALREFIRDQAEKHHQIDINGSEHHQKIVSARVSTMIDILEFLEATTRASN